MGRGRSCDTAVVVQGKKFSTRAGRILATPATPVHSIGSKSTRDHPSICMAICLTCLPRQRLRSKRRSSSAQLTGMRDFNARTVSEWPVRADWANWRKSCFFKLNTHLLEEKILATDPETYAFREFGLQIGCLLPATVLTGDPRTMQYSAGRGHAETPMQGIWARTRHAPTLPRQPACQTQLV